MLRVLTVLAAVVLAAAWLTVAAFATLAAPQDEGAHAGPSTFTTLGVIVVMALPALGFVTSVAAATFALVRRTGTAWRLLAIGIPLAAGFAVAIGTGVFDCASAPKSCAGA